jgi:iron complex outermembrane receptor protein
MVSFQAHAQDEMAAGDEVLEEIVTTGTRIKSDQFSGINPVITIDADAIAESGQLNVADVLRQQVQNTLGSNYEGFNSFSAVDANISLRGIGAGRTLVLIDGRRLPGSPKQAGAQANINMIPTEAIERVEILTDGASSIYGGDASGGVVNVITKKDFEGLSIRAGFADPDQPGGGFEDYVSIVMGAAGDRSNVVFSYEHQTRENIYWKDRWYTQSVEPTEDIADAINLSQGSRTWIDLSTFQYLPMADCIGNEAMVQGGEIFYDSTYPGDSGCLYDYTAIGSDDASRESDAVSTQLTYEISDNIEALVRATYSRVKGQSRFAPAVGSYFAPAGSLDVVFPTYLLADGTEVGPDEELNYDYDVLYSSPVVGIVDQLIAPSPRDGFGLIRWDRAGNREMDTVGDMFDLMFALDGEMENGWYWDATVQVNNQQTAEWDYNYINKTAFQGALADGLDPLADSTIALYRADLFEKATNEYRSWQFGMGKALSGDLDFYAGAEGFEFEYASRFDATREGLNAIGSAGNSSSGERDAWAVFSELLYTFGDAKLSASVRYDDYSDFGDTTNFKLGGSYDITDTLMVRASFGTSFIPPDMSSLYAADIESYPFAKDYVACDAAGIAEDDCPSRQYATYYTSNPVLDAETSENISAGMVWSPMDNLQFRVEYYDIAIEESITFLTLQALINAERQGAAALAELENSTGAFLNRNNGSLASAIQFASLLPTTNSNAEFTTNGVDLAARYVQDLGPGTLDLDLAYTQVLEYKGEEYYDGPVNDFTGRYGIPEFRYNFTVGYTLGDHSLTALVKYIDETAESIDASFNQTGNVEDQTRYDIGYTWYHPWDGRLQIGCRNCTDEDPPLTTRLDFDRTLFDNRGRMWYASLQQSF